jgi:hypothetical protein
VSSTRQHDTRIAGKNGELRYHSHTVGLLTSWERDRADRPRKIGTTVAKLTFTPGTINQFWINFGKPTHVALPTKHNGGGPRRVYELIEFDLRAGRAVFRTPPVAIEEPRR